MELNFSVGEASALSEVAIILANLSKVMKWCFFIMLAYIGIQIIKYIKRKNASPDKNQHSK